MMNKAITPASVLKRVNRALAKDQKQLIKNRGGPDRLPEWLEIDLAGDRIAGGTDDLEEFARELGVLRAWEYVARDPAPAPVARPKKRPKAPSATGRSRRKSK